MPILTDLGNKFQNIWHTYLEPVANWIGGVFIEYWKTLQRVMQDILDFITGAFSGNWEQAWNALVDLIKAPFDLLGEVLKEPLNGVIDLVNAMLDKVKKGMNFVINKINSIKMVVPTEYDMFGHVTAYQESGLGIPTINWGHIEHLYKGGVLRNGGRAIVGEYAPELLQMVGNQAVVTPLSSTPGRFPGGGQEVIVPRDQGRDITIILELDRQQFGKVVYKANNEETQRVGVRMATGGAY